MIELIFSFISKVRYYLFDINILLVEYFGEAFFRFRYGLSSFELEEVYEAIFDAISDGISIEEILSNIASSKIAADRESKARAFYDIATQVRNPLSECPISDALKPYIPKSHYKMLSRSELDSSLRESLPFIQRLTMVDQKLSKKAINTRFLSFFYFILPFCTYPFIDILIRVQSFSPRPYGSDKYDPQYIFWHNLTVLSKYGLSIFFAFSIIYFFIYFLYRDSPQTIWRKRANKLPLFKSYSALQVTTALVSVAVSIEISEGRSVPKTIRSLMSSSTEYVQDFLQEMAINVESSSLREAVNVMPMLPRNLKERLSFKLAKNDKSAKIAETAISSIEFHLENSKKLDFLFNFIGTIFQIAVLSVPLSAGAIVSASNSFT